MSERTERKTEEKNLLAAYYGKKTFVKIKQCLEIGKIQFSFVDKVNSKNHIDCYMEAEEFGAILMAGIRNGSLIKAIMTEKAKGDQYPKAVWQSPVGGNATGNNGKPISRYFEISPASSGEVLFTAHTFPAEKNDTGAFIKVKGSSPILSLRVPCTYNDLKILGYKWSFLEADYMSRKYTVENMKSDYQPKCEDTYASSEENTADDVSEVEEVTNSYAVDDVPFVGTDNVTKKSKNAVTETKMKTIKLVATSALEPVKGKNNIKVCHVTDNGIERRLICLMDKITDKKQLSSFESQLTSRVSAKKTLTFTAEVAEKGDDLYLTKFA
ncbi:hypothetical protein [Butyrivibrio sp. AC2005]|uniref:hypothetical protein n=1 Tax=Butyrivibrio sp. AC2005 TaxID=1280672 RepID=UPI0004154E51|nr:hypothetical protein [Butyrivibrio sp. AC2005]